MPYLRHFSLYFLKTKFPKFSLGEFLYQRIAIEAMPFFNYFTSSKITDTDNQLVVI